MSEELENLEKQIEEKSEDINDDQSQLLKIVKDYQKINRILVFIKIYLNLMKIFFSILKFLKEEEIIL